METDLNIADTINSTFEVLGSLAILNNCVMLYQHKEVKGLSLKSVSFFYAWSMFNLYYFHSLNQPISTYAAISMFLADSIWMAMAIYYRFFMENGRTCKSLIKKK